MLRPKNSTVQLPAGAALDMAVQLRNFEVEVVPVSGTGSGNTLCALALETGLHLAKAAPQDTVVVFAPPGCALEEELGALRMRRGLCAQLQIIKAIEEVSLDDPDE